MAQSCVNILPGGVAAVGEGTLISSGVSQLNELDEYVNSMGTETAIEKRFLSDFEENRCDTPEI